MENIQTPPEQKQPESITEQPVQKDASKKSKTPWILGLLLLGLLLLVGYLYYQNMQLKKTIQILVLNNVTTETQQVSVTPTTSSVSDNILVPPTDPTADWETYANEAFSYKLKYPSYLVVANAEGDSGGGLAPPDAFAIEINDPSDGENIYWYRYLNIESRAIVSPFGETTDVVLGGTPGIKEIMDGGEREIYYIKIPNSPSGDYLMIQIVYRGKDEIKKEVVDQILSTFQFTE